MRCRTERNPVCTTLISGVNVPGNQGFRPKIPSVVLEFLRRHETNRTPTGKMKTCGTQSMFREMETQTDPFAAEVKQPYRPSLEVLTLSWLSWNNGLPAGMREVIVIERARQKKAWNRALPAPFNAAASSIQRMILEAIEENEWNHREVELAALSSVRMDLARKCLEENVAASKMKYEKKLCKYKISSLHERNEALKKVRHRFRRNMRKLVYIHENMNRKYYRWNVWHELEDKTSEWYGPQQRFGVHPKRGHEFIPKHFRYWNVFSTGDIINQKLERILKPKNIAFDYINKSKPRQHLKQLCIRETKWTPIKLQKLYHSLIVLRELKSKASREKTHYELRRRIARTVGPINTPKVQAMPDQEEDIYQAAIIFQKIIKGRAIQAVMFEGRVRCQELLEELKSTHALLGIMEAARVQTRHVVYSQQRRAEMKALEEKRKNEILLSLEGKTVSDILDHLSKELLRIQKERETHALALMADKVRNEKEAAEAGRRQMEEERSREYDEMWKQICKLFQNSLDLAMEAAVSYRKQLFSTEEAQKEAAEYAKKIDEAAAEAHLRSNQLEAEEIVADLVYNFALPEAEKQMVRTRLREKHRSLLSTCHDEIYSQVEMVVKGERSPSGRLVSIPCPKPQAGRKNFVTYLKLARQSGNSTVSVSKSSLYGAMQGWQNEPEKRHHKFSEKGDGGEGDHWSTGFSRQEVLID